MASLAEIRARLQAAEGNKGGQSSQGGGDKSIYPHWNMEEGQSATLRFLPDGNTKNTFFWQERAMIRLPFAGIKGEGDSKQVYVQVPCVEMWGEACPILAEVRTWFKDKSLEEMGRKYWKKRSYLFHMMSTHARNAGGTSSSSTGVRSMRFHCLGSNLLLPSKGPHMYT